MTRVRTPGLHRKNALGCNAPLNCPLDSHGTRARVRALRNPLSSQNYETNLTANADPPNGTLVAAWVPLSTNLDTALGKWDDVADAGTWLQFCVQSSPVAGEDNPYVPNQEVCSGDFAATSGHLAFDLGFTPTNGNQLLVVAMGSTLFDGPSSLPSGWTALCNHNGMFAALRTWHTADGTSFDLGANAGNSSWYGWIYKIASATYRSETDAVADYTVSGYETPNDLSDVGPTLCVYAVSVPTSSTDTYPSYSINSYSGSRLSGASP